MKYLYYSNRFYGLCRLEIIKETPHFFVLKNKRVSKKTMSSENDWGTVWYKVETPEILDKYLKQEHDKAVSKEFNILLHKLGLCKNVVTMQKWSTVFKKLIEEQSLTN